MNVRPKASRYFEASPWLLALLFLALHLPYLPQSLEDVDSINFALGLHAFDVARHQPHPPGYPLFIAAARAVRLLVGPDARALALVSVVAGTIGVVGIAALLRRLGAGILAAALAVAAPLYWLTANRPLSDMTGLAAAVVVQGMILGATSLRGVTVAALCGGFAAGLRSQVFWLTAPLLVWANTCSPALPGCPAADSRPEGLRCERPPCPATDRSTRNVRRLVAPVLAYAVGIALWAVPLVVVSGGPGAYWHALFDQGAEDLSGIRMLWTTPTVRELADALYYAFVAPWAVWPLAATVLALASIGAVGLWKRDRASLAAIAVAFGPYLVFDILFQETFTSRYALPLVVPAAYLAARGAAIVPTAAGIAAAIAAAMFSAHVGGTSLAAYAAQPAPAFPMLADMERTPVSSPPVVGMDRREAFDLRAPVKYGGGALPAGGTALPSPPQREWLEVVGQLNGRAKPPLWYVADPKRTDIDLVQHGEPARYRWPLPYPVLIDGVRPNEMDWYELDAPEWWLGEGWSVTPEVAGVSDADRRGLGFGPIDGWLSPTTAGGALVLGGRNFDASRTPRIDVRVDGQPIDTFDAPAGTFVRAARLPADSHAARIHLQIVATPPSRVAIEQFDASASRVLVGFGAGWHESEYTPATGLRWRWVGDHGDVRIVFPRRADALVLRLAGESPLKYFSRPSTLTVRADGAPVFSQALAEDFSLTIPIPRPAAVLTVETDQTYVPAERSRRTADRRRLGLRIFTCEVRAVSAPGR